MALNEDPLKLVEYIIDNSELKGEELDDYIDDLRNNRAEAAYILARTYAITRNPGVPFDTYSERAAAEVIEHMEHVIDILILLAGPRD